MIAALLAVSMLGDWLVKKGTTSTYEAPFSLVEHYTTLHSRARPLIWVPPSLGPSSCNQLAGAIRLEVKECVGCNRFKKYRKRCRQPGQHHGLRSLSSRHEQHVVGVHPTETVENYVTAGLFSCGEVTRRAILASSD